MTASTAIFHKFVASLGPEFAVGEIEASSESPPSDTAGLRGMADIIRAIEALTAGTAHPFRYCAGNIASARPTGYCSLLDGHYCLGITTTFYTCCFEAAFRLFQSDQTFLDIDPPTQPPKREVDEEGLDLPWGFYWLPLVKEHIDRFAPHEVPPFDPSNVPGYAANFAVASPLRSACARYVTLMMVRFLWYHEFAHVISGHLPYLEETKRIRTLSENDWLDLPVDKQLATSIRIWMEHDADTSAAKTLLHATLTGRMVAPVGVAEVDTNIALRIRLDMMAIVLALLVIFSQHDWMVAPGTHPDPNSRIYVTVATAMHMLQAHPQSGPLMSLIWNDFKTLIKANGRYANLAMFASPLTTKLQQDEYNDLVAFVSTEIPRVRAHSFFDEDGLFRG